MTNNQSNFLEQKLSDPKAESYLMVNDIDEATAYLMVHGISAWTSKFLNVFDQLALGGYSKERGEQLQREYPTYNYAANKPFVVHTEQDRPLDQQLSSVLATLQGEERKAFLYGLRDTLLKADALLQIEEKNVESIRQALDSYSAIVDKVKGGDKQFLTNLAYYFKIVDKSGLEGYLEGLKTLKEAAKSYDESSLQLLGHRASVYADISMIMLDSLGDTHHKPHNIN